MKSPTQLKILSTVWHRPGLFRKDLEAITGFHPNTVARAVDSLLAKGYIREMPAIPLEGRGRPHVPLAVDPERMCVGGVAIGPGAVEAVVLNLQGHPISPVVREQTSTPAEITHAVGERLQELLRSNPIALGVSVTGFFDPERKRLLFGSASPMAEIDLAPIFRCVGDTPINLNSDIHAMAIRWMKRQAKSEDDDVLVVSLEDGAVGASFLVGGMPNKGCVLGGNELGHMRLAVETDRCYCGGVGCVERVFSTAYLNRLGDPAMLGDALARRKPSDSAQRIIDLFAAALVSATVFARPSQVVVGGSFVNLPSFRHALEAAWRRQLPSVFQRRVSMIWYPMRADVSAETAGWLAIADVLRGTM